MLLLLACGLSGCSDPDRDRLLETTRPTYDQKTGQLVELTYDANSNGRIDTWTDMAGTRPLQSRTDRDEDGQIDRWEYYDENGGLFKVGFSRHDNGTPDAWAFAGPDGRVQRVELSSTGDESQIDRWEYYDPARADSNGLGALVRAERDTNHDGRPDTWETYEGGGIKTAAFDENGDGVPDRQLTYDGADVVSVEHLSPPASKGR